MIPTFYDSPAKITTLRAAAEHLRGTPFFANSEAPGRDGGIDCVHALNWIHRTTGAIGPLEIPRQRMDHGQHSDRSLLIEAFETWPELKSRFACIRNGAAPPSARASNERAEDGAAPTPSPAPDLPAIIPAGVAAGTLNPELLLPGDCLCFLAGHVPHHGGVLLDGGELLHVLKRDGAHTMQLRAVIRGRSLLGYLAAAYRPLPL